MPSKSCAISPGLPPRTPHAVQSHRDANRLDPRTATACSQTNTSYEIDCSCDVVPRDLRTRMEPYSLRSRPYTL